MTQYFIFDTNFFIDLVNLRARSAINAIQRVFSKHQMLGFVTNHVLEEVKDRIIRTKIEQAFQIIPSPGPEDPFFFNLNEYGSRRKVLNHNEPKKYFKREFDPDLELVWLSLRIQDGTFTGNGFPPYECIIVTDDEGVENFQKDYCAFQYTGDPKWCQVIKPYIFLQRILSLAPSGQVREMIERAEGDVFQTRMDFKGSMGRTQDLVKTIYQMRREVIRNINQIQESTEKGDISWTNTERQLLEEFLETEEDLPPERQKLLLTTNHEFQPIMLAMRNLIRISRHWTKFLPVPEEIYQLYYRLLFEINLYKTNAHHVAPPELSRFFFLSLVVDSKVFDIFLQVNAAFLREAKIAQSIETMTMLEGHLSGLETGAILAFHALLSFLWLAKGEAARAKSILSITPAEYKTQRAKESQEPGKEPEVFRSTLALLNLLDNNFTSLKDVEDALAQTLKPMSACLDDDLATPEYQECSRALQNLSQTLSSLGSPFAEKLLYLTAVAKKICCVPPEEFTEAAKKYIEAARVANAEIRTPEIFKGIDAPDQTTLPLPAEYHVPEYTLVTLGGNGVYTKHFHVIENHGDRAGFTLTCWFEPLQSRVLLLLPRTPEVEKIVKDPHKIRLLSGDIKTSLQKSLLVQHNVRVLIQAAPNIRVEAINRSA